MDRVRVRTRREGDYIHLKEDSMKQKLKKFFSNNKIDVEARKKTMLLTDGSEVIWIVGHRVNPKYKADKKTRKVLKVKVDFLDKI